MRDTLNSGGVGTRALAAVSLERPIRTEVEAYTSDESKVYYTSRSGEACLR